MYELSVKMRFSAAHHLAGYAGKCAAHHGHNWDVEVFVAGKRLNALGMLTDFRTLKDEVRRCLEAMDHLDLNELPAFKRVNPTSENIARHLFDALSRRINTRGCRIAAVCVCESPETRACYRKDTGSR